MYFDDESNLIASNANFNSYANHYHYHPSPGPVDPSTGSASINPDTEHLTKAEEMLQKVQKELTCLNYLQSHEAALGRVEEGTGQWFLDTTDFQDWKNGSQGVKAILGWGVPGAGKTCLMSIVINQLQSQRLSHHSGSTTRVAYIYLHHQEAKQQTPARIVSTLLKQILLTYSNFPDYAISLYNQLAQDQGQPQMKVMVSTLVNACKDKQFTTYIILDAFDETSYPKELKNLLKEFLTAEIRLLVTCRQGFQDIIALFRDTPFCALCPITAPQKDLTTFLKNRLETNEAVKSIVQGEFQQKVIDTIQVSSQGIFMIAALQVEHIILLPTRRDMEEALSQFPLALEENLKITLNRIRTQQSPAYSNLAWKSLRLLAYAFRPLTISEMLFALAIDENSDTLDSNNFTSPIILVQACMGLVNIGSPESIIRFCHASVQHMILKEAKQVSNFDKTFATMCLMCLSLKKFIDRNGKTYQWLKVTESMLGFGFYSYAAENWGHHAKLCFDDEIVEKILKFIQKKEHLLLWGKWSYGLNQLLYEENSSSITILHIAAYFGWDKFQVLISKDECSTIVNNKVAWTRETALILAIRFGQEKVAQHLLSILGIDVNAKGLDKQTALMYAAQAGYKSIVELLCEKGANKEAEGGYSTALFIAILHEHISVVEYLIDKGANLFAKGQLITRQSTSLLADIQNDIQPLHLAANKGNVSIVELLIEKGADISAKDGNGFTGLHQASLHGHFLTVRFLVEKGASVNAQSVVDDGATTPLYYAVMNGHLQIVQLLFNNGACLTAKKKDTGWQALHAAAFYGHLPIIQWLIQQGVDLLAKDSQGFIVLHMAAYNGNIHSVRWLIEKGADPSAQSTIGWQPVHAAAQGGNLDIVQLLVQKGVDISAKINKGWTVLHLAASEGQVEMLQYFLELGLDFSVKTNDGFTPSHIATGKRHLTVIKFLENHGLNFIDSQQFLHLAAEKGDLDLMKKLIQQGANPLAKNSNVFTTLHLAAYYGYKNIVEWLIEKEADPSAQSIIGWQPVHAAAQGGNLDIVQLLVQKGVEISAKNHNGWSVLHTAAYGGKVTALEYFLGLGFDFSAQTNDGSTLLHIAADQGQLDAVKFLLEQGLNVFAVNNNKQTPLDISKAKKHTKVAELLEANIKLLTFPPIEANGTLVPCICCLLSW